MDSSSISFLVLSFIAIVCALMVIFASSPVYSVLFLVLTFMAVAGHYAFLLHAEFLAIVNVIVYAGAIMVLFLFVIMLLNLNKQAEPLQPFLTKLGATIAGGLFLFTLFVALRGNAFAPIQGIKSSQEIGLVKTLGLVLFDEYLLPFELSSVLFLSAMVGAVMLGKKDLKDH